MVLTTFNKKMKTSPALKIYNKFPFTLYYHQTPRPQQFHPHPHHFSYFYVFSSSSFCLFYVFQGQSLMMGFIFGFHVAAAFRRGYLRQNQDNYHRHFLNIFYFCFSSFLIWICFRLQSAFLPFRFLFRVGFLLVIFLFLWHALFLQLHDAISVIVLKSFPLRI